MSMPNVFDGTRADFLGIRLPGSVSLVILDVIHKASIDVNLVRDDRGCCIWIGIDLGITKCYTEIGEVSYVKYQNNDIGSKEPF